MDPKRRYKVFYTLFDDDREVLADSPVEMSLEEVCDELFPRLKHHDDFLGIVDKHEGCFQVRIAGEFLLDVPVIARQGSLRLFVDEREALRRLRSVPDEITAEAFPDFEFEPWSQPESKPWWKFW